MSGRDAATRDLSRLERHRAAAPRGGRGDGGGAGAVRQPILGPSLGPRRRGGWSKTARDAVAALVGASPDGVVFTSGGTEANHLALLGAGRERVLVSAVEHDSVLHAAADAEHIPVDRDGIVELDALEPLLAADPRPALVSVMLANNETGVIQPVAEIAALAHAHGALFHCDAVQAAGKIPLDLAAHWRRSA